MSTDDPKPEDHNPIQNTEAFYNPQTGPGAPLLVADAMGGHSIESNILAMEERGGRQIAAQTSRLPTQGLDRDRAAFEAMGIKIGAVCEDDKLFTRVEMPEGFKIVSNSSLWSKLVDAQGRERASMFYKAAFYDRDAFISACLRFTIGSEFPPHPDVAGEADIRRCRKHVVDRADVKHEHGDDPASFNLRERGSVLFSGPWVEGYNKPEEKQAEQWLDEHRPDWKNPAAYWDEVS